MKRRFIGALIGLGYAVLLIFFLMMITGGGHGNFTWVVFFLLTSLFGGFYPVIGFLMANLRPLMVKSAFVVIFLVHFYLVYLFFTKGFIVPNSSPSDFSWSSHPIMTLITISFLSLPRIGCIAFFTADLVRHRSVFH